MIVIVNLFTISWMIATKKKCSTHNWIHFGTFRCQEFRFSLLPHKVVIGTFVVTFTASISAVFGIKNQSDLILDISVYTLY